MDEPLWHALDPQTEQDVATFVGKTIAAVRLMGEASLTECILECTDGTRLLLCATTDACDSPFLVVETGGEDE